jgi:transcriptional regulator with XRE-family HTH domain
MQFSIEYGKQLVWVIHREMTTQGRSNRAMAKVLGISQLAANQKIAGSDPFTIDELKTVADWLGSSPSELARRAETETRA